MTLQDLIIDLHAMGVNENTLRLAMNCYEQGQADEREACAKVCDDMVLYTGHDCADAIRARGQQPDLSEVMERPATRLVLPVYEQSVPGVVQLARAE
jgi:hypothetical protein